MFPKLIYRFNAISIKISTRCFIDIVKVNLNSMWKDKGTRIAKTILTKGIKWGNIQTNFKTYCLVTVIKPVWYYRDGHMGQWNRIENLEIASHKWGQLLFHRGAGEVQYRKNSISTNAVRAIEHLQVKIRTLTWTSHLMKKLTQIQS